MRRAVANSLLLLFNGESGEFISELQTVSPTTDRLTPIPLADERRKKLIQQYVAIGSHQNATTKIINQLPEELLGDAEGIIELVSREKSENYYGRNWKYGGRAYNQLKHLFETGEISNSILDKIVELPSLDPDKQLESSDDEVTEQFDEIPDIPQPLTQDPVAKTSQGLSQLSLPISFSEIREVNQEAEELWTKCLKRLKSKISAQTIETWFTTETLSAIEIRHQTLILQAANATAHDWIKKNYVEVLQNSIDEATRTKGVWKIECIQ